MATWIAHMRVAEYFMNKNKKLDNVEFLVGNIGPDCGVPNEDWSAFTPPKSVTHWKTADNAAIDAEDFKSKYLNQRSEKFPFYLGYYFHLLTDIEWSKFYKQKKCETTYLEAFKKKKDAIWMIKKDWYGHDHLFLKDNPSFVFYTVFSKIDAFPNEYFEFYPENAFIRQIKYITDFYLSAHEDAKRDFPFLSKLEMDSFINETIQVIENTNLTT